MDISIFDTFSSFNVIGQACPQSSYELGFLSRAVGLEDSEREEGVKVLPIGSL